MKKIPVSLIIDDSGVVNMAHFHSPQYAHDLLIPPAFAKEFAAV